MYLLVEASINALALSVIRPNFALKHSNCEIKQIKGKHHNWDPIRLLYIFLPKVRVWYIKDNSTGYNPIWSRGLIQGHKEQTCPIYCISKITLLLYKHRLCSFIAAFRVLKSLSCSFLWLLKVTVTLEIFKRWNTRLNNRSNTEYTELSKPRHLYANVLSLQTLHKRNINYTLMHS